jgi:IS5 family transposase
MNDFSYEELGFHLADSRTYRSFCRLGWGEAAPSAKTLQRNIKRVRPETLEAVNRAVVRGAAVDDLEDGSEVRIDCTVVETNIHAPTDSALLSDCVRVLVRLLRRAQVMDPEIRFADHTTRAKRRAWRIQNIARRGPRRKPYEDLLKVTRKTIRSATAAIERLLLLVRNASAEALRAELVHFIDLARRVVDQCRRRVILGQKVSAQDKVLSIFEPHTDIIIKDWREVLYGHKICLSAGASGLVSDLIVESGNPCDSTLAVGMVQRQVEIYGRPPTATAFDGGFASRPNLTELKAMGVEAVCFSKSRGIPTLEMTPSVAVYRRLRDFRAGVEGVISMLKRRFGLSRCTWRGLESFKSYAWASALAANLLTLARRTPKAA